MNRARNLKSIYCHGYDYEDGQQGMGDVQVDFPTKCEHCEHVGEQREIVSCYTFSDNLYNYRFDLCHVIMILSCPYCNNHTIHLMCENSFFYPNSSTPVKFFQTFKTIPDSTKSESLRITDEIKALSGSFVKIYDQSMQAESTGLDEIAGVGYRKALEFLVTDYLLSKKPDQQEFIKNPKTTLGSKIAMLPEELGDYAKASSYLGNDETHYTRRHPEKGIEDLKAFIELFTIEISRDIIRTKAKKLIGKSNLPQENP